MDDHPVPEAHEFEGSGVCEVCGSNTGDWTIVDQAATYLTGLLLCVECAPRAQAVWDAAYSRRWRPNEIKPAALVAWEQEGV